MKKRSDELRDSRNMLRYRGVVEWFDPKKGIGFVRPDDPKISSEKDLFVHFHYIVHRGYKTLQKGDIVEFSLGSNHKGICTKEVKIIKAVEEA